MLLIFYHCDNRKCVTVLHCFHNIDIGLLAFGTKNVALNN